MQNNYKSYVHAIAMHQTFQEFNHDAENVRSPGQYSSDENREEDESHPQNDGQSSGPQETEEELYSGPNRGYYDDGAPGYYGNDGPGFTRNHGDESRGFSPNHSDDGATHSSNQHDDRRHDAERNDRVTSYR